MVRKAGQLLNECEECGEALEPCPRCGKPYCGGCSGERYCPACASPQERQAFMESSLRMIFSGFGAPSPTSIVEAARMVDGLRHGEGVFEGEATDAVLSRLWSQFKRG